MMRRHPTPNQRSLDQRGQTIGWIMTVMAVIAIAILIVVQIRSTQRSTSMEAQSRQQVEQLQRSLRGNEALLRLNALRSEIEAGVDPQSLPVRYNAIRIELEESFSDRALGRVREDLDMLASQFLEGGEGAADTIDRVVAELSSVPTGSESE
jgi:hypothetical protein